MGMSQSGVGRSLDVSSQQIQKYESSQNRISASKLHQVAEALDVPVGFFFGPNEADDQIISYEADTLIAQLTGGAEALALNRAFRLIMNPEIRRKVVDFVQAIGGGGAPCPAAADNPSVQLSPKSWLVRVAWRMISSRMRQQAGHRREVGGA